MIQNGFWGKEYPKADYPIRERKKVQVFDIKKFVDEKRKKKMEEMFGPSAGKGPMPSRPMTSRPMPGGMPSRPMTPPMGPTPPTGDFNVDEIVKRIDAKIAELEEEERKEKEKWRKRESRKKRDGLERQWRPKERKARTAESRNATNTTEASGSRNSNSEGTTTPNCRGEENCSNGSTNAI